MRNTQTLLLTCLLGLGLGTLVGCQTNPPVNPAPAVVTGTASNEEGSPSIGGNPTPTAPSTSTSTSTGNSGKTTTPNLPGTSESTSEEPLTSWENLLVLLFGASVIPILRKLRDIWNWMNGYDPTRL